MTKNNRFSPAFEEGHFYGLVDDSNYLRQSSLYKQILPRTPSRLKTSALSAFSAVKTSCLSDFVAINPFNQRNLCPRYPRLINYLCLRKLTYEKIKLFLQNEPNFRKSQVSLSDYITREYEQMDTWSIRKNEPKTNPNEPKTNPILANKTPVRTQFKPKQSQFKAKQTQFPIILVSLKWLCIISFSVMLTLLIFMETI